MELLRNLLCVAGGVALGYFLAHTRLEAKYIEKVDREIDEAKKYYQKKYEDQIAADAESVKEAAESMTQYAAAKKDVEEIEDRPKSVGLIKIKAHSEPDVPIKVTGGKKDLVAPTPPKTNYNHIMTPPKVSADSEEAEASEEEDEQVDVEFISKADFVSDQFGYKQIMLTYWAEDDVLSNEQDQPILGSAREVSVGQQALERLKAGGEAMNNEESIYVRNRSGKWEFEITRVQESYTDLFGPVLDRENAPVDAME